jgi:hypothetical protein
MAGVRAYALHPGALWRCRPVDSRRADMADRPVAAAHRPWTAAALECALVLAWAAPAHTSTAPACHGSRCGAPPRRGAPPRAHGPLSAPAGAVGAVGTRARALTAPQLPRSVRAGVQGRWAARGRSAPSEARTPRARRPRAGSVHSAPWAPWLIVRVPTRMLVRTARRRSPAGDPSGIPPDSAPPCS